MSYSETIVRLNEFSDFVSFERLCCDILANYGPWKGIIPQGVGRIDGGKDAVLITRTEYSVTAVDKRIVYHFSLRRDFEQKLREDLHSTQLLADPTDVVVFVTSQKVTAHHKDRLKIEVSKQFGWELEVYDQEWLRIPLDGEFQRLRRHYLGIEYDQHVFAPLEVILELPNRHPNRRDFGIGAFFDDVELRKKVESMLDSRRVCLILGTPGSGKTSLGIAVGHYFEDGNATRIAFYLSARAQPTYGEWLKHIHGMDHDYITFILDDCHVSPINVNELVARLPGIKRARLLLISRSIGPALSGSARESFLDTLDQETILIESDIPRIRGVVSAVLQRDNLPKVDPGPLEPVLERCQGDLHLLDFLTTAWSSNVVATTALADTPDDAILDGVFRRYLAGTPFQEETCSIAALSASEIPVEAHWVGRRSTLADLQQSAFIESRVLSPRGAPIEFIEFFHSTPAQFVLNAAAAKGLLRGSSAVAFYEQEVLRYLLSEPSNLFSAIFVLYRTSATEMLSTFFGNSSIPSIIERQIDAFPLRPPDELLRMFFNFLTGLWRFESMAPDGAAFKAVDYFLRRYEHTDKECFSKLGGETLAAGLRVVRIHARLGEAFVQKVDLGNLRASLEEGSILTLAKVATSARTSSIDAFDLDVLIAGLDFERICEQSRGVGIAPIVNLLGEAHRCEVDPTRVHMLVQSLDFPLLGVRSRRMAMSTISRFLRFTRMFGADVRSLNAFCLRLDFVTIGRQARDAGLANIVKFMQLLRQSHIGPKIIGEFSAGLNFELLGHRSRNVGFRIILNFLKEAVRVGVPRKQLRMFFHSFEFEALGSRAVGASDGSGQEFRRLLHRVGVNTEDIEAFEKARNRGKFEKTRFSDNA